MASVHAQILDVLGYDPDDGLPQADAIDVPVGAIVRAREGARPVAVARLDSGRLVVVDDRCPHDGGRISDGWVEGERIICARHGWELDGEGKRCPLVSSNGPDCKLRE